MKRRTQRRWLARAALCLALGLVTTVAVAWALAAWLPHENMWKGRTAEVVEPFHQVYSLIETHECGRPGMVRRKWRVEEWAEFSLDTAFWDDRFQRGERAISRSGPRWGLAWTPEAERHGGWEDARGWPALCLWCEFHRVLSGGTWQWSCPTGGVVVTNGPGAFDVRVLPLRPLWPGLLANSGAYTLAWGVVLVVPGWVRRARRRANGWCAGCGYDRAGLAEDAECPECGEGRGDETPNRA